MCLIPVHVSHFRWSRNDTGSGNAKTRHLKNDEDALTLVFLHGDGALGSDDPAALSAGEPTKERLTPEVVHLFLAGLGTGGDLDFSKRKLALAGHSLGGIVASPPTVPSLLMTTYYPLLKISSLHLFEPFLLSEKLQDWGPQFEKIADKRRDIWPNEEDQMSLPITPEYPDLKVGATLKCLRRQEAVSGPFCGQAKFRHGYGFHIYHTHTDQRICNKILYSHESWQSEPRTNVSFDVGGVEKNLDLYARSEEICDLGQWKIVSNVCCVADEPWERGSDDTEHTASGWSGSYDGPNRFLGSG
ncbi:hypothetical protein EV363DRAFT_1297453 [Boletus edulis]|nr:hypothetical protein EV363DRAFT_1297453 [Boletus edulis]